MMSLDQESRKLFEKIYGMDNSDDYIDMCSLNIEFNLKQAILYDPRSKSSTFVWRNMCAICLDGPDVFERNP